MSMHLELLEMQTETPRQWVTLQVNKTKSLTHTHSRSLSPSLALSPCTTSHLTMACQLNNMGNMPTADPSTEMTANFIVAVKSCTISDAWGLSRSQRFLK